MQMTRESIFVSAVRAFCTTFAGLLGIFIALAIGIIALLMLSTSDITPPPSEIQIAADAEGNRTMLPIASPVILKVNLKGVIGDKSLKSQSVINMLLDSREHMLAGNRVKGVLLYIDSPGGTVNDGDDIYRAILAYKKKYQVPIYTYVSGLCASGGFYIACASDKIYASPTSQIGSVGVILGPLFNFSQAMEKFGIQSLTLTQGKDKDMLNPYRPWVPGEDQSERAIMNTLYQRFVDIVASSRPNLDKQKLVDNYGAQMFIGEEAQRLGYIDVANSSYEEAVAALAQVAGIPANQAYQVVQLTGPENFLDQLFNARSALLSGQVTHRLDLGPYMNPALSGQFLYLYQPRP